MKALVHGASGFTGSRVVERLRTFAVDVVSTGREAGSVDELRAVMRGCDVAVNCAGPFAQTSRMFEEAALVAQCSAIHIGCEAAVVRETWARDEDARAAGVVLGSSAGFSTVLAELCTWLAAKTLGPMARISALVSHDPGTPSRGTLRVYLAEADEPVLTFRQGRFEEVVRDSVDADMSLHAPLPELAALQKDFSATTIQTRLVVQEGSSRVFMRDRALLETLLETAPMTPSARGGFCWRVTVEDREGKRRTVTMRGEDTYALSAEICAFVALNMDRSRIGAHTAFSLVDPQVALACLARSGVRWSVA
jgi:hypothetical protein